MKAHQLLSAICLAASIYSCNNDKNATTHTTQSQKPDSKKDETTKPTDVPFVGNWISKKYLNILDSKKSPRLGSMEHTAIHMHIPATENTEFTIGYNFHEGIPGNKIKKEGDTYFIINENEKQTIKIIDNSTIEVNGEQLLKIDNSTSYNQNAVNDYFFKGIYTYNEQKVSFSKDNKLSGLENYKYYDLNLDYVGPGLDIDIIYLGESEKSKKAYGFKQQNNNLLIYNIKCVDGTAYNDDEPCDEITFGDLKYTITHN